MIATQHARPTISRRVAIAVLLFVAVMAADAECKYADDVEEYPGYHHGMSVTEVAR